MPDEVKLTQAFLLAQKAMNKQTIIKDFSALGSKMVTLSGEIEKEPYTTVFQKANTDNPWFTFKFMAEAFRAVGQSLAPEKLEKWLSAYTLPEKPAPKTIGLVLAGNIPLVGFHDILCTLVSGHNVLAKLSSKDQHLYSILKNLLTEINPVYDQRITFTDRNLQGMDAIIATGSDNSARYFDYYFAKYPHIIRKNRNSLAILAGDETDAELELLADDIFMYFGLGCRNVSMLWLPESFPIDRLFRSFEKYYPLIDHHKYGNNYEYQRAIKLLNQETFLDNNMVLLKEDARLASPIAVVHYQWYASPQKAINYIDFHGDKIQCVVSKTKWPFDSYELGAAQKPELWDYADQVDTLSFLLNLNTAV
ncbi:MAG TPA: acyl-CoA reductase [Marinilabiliales bacterium]|nr:acyl-CoA reductase [Marinilabiliales bacterium]